MRGNWNNFKSKKISQIYLTYINIVGYYILIYRDHAWYRLRSKIPVFLFFAQILDVEISRPFPFLIFFVLWNVCTGTIVHNVNLTGIKMNSCILFLGIPLVCSGDFNDGIEANLRFSYGFSFNEHCTKRYTIVYKHLLNLFFHRWERNSS